MRPRKHPYDYPYDILRDAAALCLARGAEICQSRRVGPF
jgi:hypothetical protein